MTSVGLIGVGRWGKNILRDLLRLDVKVHVATLLKESRESALHAGASSVCDTSGELPQVDGFVVATPTTTHASVIEELLPRGCPIFVEKPLTNDLLAARRLDAKAADRIFVMDKWRYHPGIEALASLARSNELGDILVVHTYRLGWGNPHQDVDASWILMPHDLSIAFEILRFLPSAHSVVCTSLSKKSFNLIAVLQNNRNETRVITEISTYHPVSRRSVVVVGSKGSAQLADTYDDRILYVKHSSRVEPEQTKEIMVSTDMPLLRELGAFISYLRGGPPPRSSCAEGLLIVERIAALRAISGLQ